MRRSHILLVGAVAIAGTAAMLGNRSGSSTMVAMVEGAPLAPHEAEGDRPGKTGSRLAPGAAATMARPTTTAAIAELIDLDQLILVRGTEPAIDPSPSGAGQDPSAGSVVAPVVLGPRPSGDHYEAVLKDGRRAVLTLDPALQAYAEKLLSDARAPRGAIVAMTPDGRILALAGRRTEGTAKKAPATFDWRLATETWAPAASVFKLVTAAALVSAGVDPSDKVCYHGGLRSVMASNLQDDKRDSRCETLTYGVAHSNNAILGKLAYQKLEPSALTTLARTLGVTDTLPGSELRGSAGAIDIPDVRDLGFARAAAGFVGSRLSVIGGALLAATFADDGEQPIPQIVASIDGVAQTAPAPRRMIAPEVARAVGKMMMATCEIGSAAKSFGKRRPIRVAGKTGTLTRTDPFYMEHSWFVGYAPAEQPQIIVSVLLGNPESWHLRGHEAASRLIDRALRPARAHDKDRRAKKRRRDA